MQEKYLIYQGEAITKALRERGYLAQQIGLALNWAITRTEEEEEFWVMMTFIPRPVNQWRLLPDGNGVHHREIYQVIEQTLGGRR